MAVGLRVRDPANGQILIDLATRMTKIIGSFNTGTNPGSITDANLTALPGSTGFITTLPPLGYAGRDTPSIVISGATISWSWKYANSGGRAAVDVIYGFYTGNP